MSQSHERETPYRQERKYWNTRTPFHLSAHVLSRALLWGVSTRRSCQPSRSYVSSLMCIANPQSPSHGIGHGHVTTAAARSPAAPAARATPRSARPPPARCSRPPPRRAAATPTAGQRSTSPPRRCPHPPRTGARLCLAAGIRVRPPRPSSPHAAACQPSTRPHARPRRNSFVTSPDQP